MITRIFHPAPALSDVVEFYYYYTIDFSQPAIQYYATPLLQGMAFNIGKQAQHHTYNGKTETIKNQAYLFGQCTCPRVIMGENTGAEIIGVKFRPLGITKITGINMEHMADRTVAAEDLWGHEFESLFDEMQSASCMENAIAALENFLLKKYLKTKVHYRVDSIQNALLLISQQNGNLSIKALQKTVNISRKTLERAFTHTIGIQPKLYARIVRFNAIKGHMDRQPYSKNNLISLAHDYGFYDSSHFTAEFKYFSGITPMEYLKGKNQMYFSTAN